MNKSWNLSFKPKIAKEVYNLFKHLWFTTFYQSEIKLKK